jgi:hypothetical protein
MNIKVTADFAFFLKQKKNRSQGAVHKIVESQLF